MSEAGSVLKKNKTRDVTTMPTGKLIPHLKGATTTQYQLVMARQELGLNFVKYYYFLLCPFKMRTSKIQIGMRRVFLSAPSIHLQGTQRQ